MLRQAAEKKQIKIGKNRKKYFYLFLLVFTYFSFDGLPQKKLVHE